MSSQLGVGRYLTLDEAAKSCHGTIGYMTVWRWARYGIKSRSGECVRLRHERHGKLIYTTPEWLRDFFAATSNSDLVHFVQRTERLRATALATPTRKRRTIRDRAATKALATAQVDPDSQSAAELAQDGI